MEGGSESASCPYYLITAGVFSILLPFDISGVLVIASLSFLILVTFFICKSYYRFANVIDLFKEPTLCSISFLYCLSVLNSIDFCSLLFSS